MTATAMGNPDTWVYVGITRDDAAWQETYEYLPPSVNTGGLKSNMFLFDLNGAIDDIGGWANFIKLADITGIIYYNYTTGFDLNAVQVLHYAETPPCEPELIPVEIDIKPGSCPNSINLKSKGKVPVAILSTPEFYAPEVVDRGAVKFADASPLSIGKSPQDVNCDGLLDIVLHFSTQALDLEPGDTEALLTGKTLSGQEFEGSDSVRIVY